MLNFKLRKGEIATLLTLGLVVVGTLITLGTSLFVSNKKTNLASNSMAASPKVGCIDYGSSSGCSSDCKYDKPTYSCLGDSITGIKKWCCSPGAIPTPIPIATLKPLPACSFTLLQAATKCTEYTSDGCGKSVGKQTYKCVTGTTVPTAIPKPTTGTSYPEDDSCWLVKCMQGKPKKIKYAGSLSKSSMPLTSCQGGSPYSGGGWMIIGAQNADDVVNTFNCENGNEEITKVPTKPPSKTCGEYVQGDHFCSGNNQMWCDNGVKKKVVTCEIGCKDNKDGTASCIPYNSTPTPGTGTPSTTTPIPTSQCESGPITCKSGNNKNKTYYFLKSTSENCQENMSNNKCYSVNNGGLYSTNCEVLNWLQLENEVCQINNVIDPSPVTNNIICNFINCPNFSQLGYYYRAYTDKYFIDKKSCTNASNVGNTQEYVKNNVCGNSSVQVIQESITGTMLYSPEGNCNLLPNGLCAVNNLNSSSNN